MHRLVFSAFVCGFASISFAQTGTITLLVPGADPQPLVASIVGSDATATTYAVQCSPGTDSDNCGFVGVFTLTEGPATAAYTYGPMVDDNGTVALTGYIDCSLAGTTSAVCIESFGGTEANFPGISTETLTGTDLPYMLVVITAQAVASDGSSSSVVPSNTQTGSKATSNSVAGAKTSSSGAESTGAAQTTASKTSVSTAGMPMITANMEWLVGGAAVALAVVS